MTPPSTNPTDERIPIRVSETRDRRVLEEVLRSHERSGGVALQAAPDDTGTTVVFA